LPYVRKITNVCISACTDEYNKNLIKFLAQHKLIDWNNIYFEYSKLDFKPLTISYVVSELIKYTTETKSIILNKCDKLVAKPQQLLQSELLCENVNNITNFQNMIKELSEIRIKVFKKLQDEVFDVHEDLFRYIKDNSTINIYEYMKQHKLTLNSIVKFKDNISSLRDVAITINKEALSIMKCL